MRVAVDDVTVRRGGATLLSSVSLSVSPGEFVGVVGPNGAGKTTLLRTVDGTLAPDDGSVRVGGDDVQALPSGAASRRVATLPQDPAVDFSFTVREVVEMGRFAHVPRFGTDPDPEAVDRALRRAEVAALADREVTSLSGGERQRVLVARALAQDAPVLLLDEPTASLDVNHQVRVLELARGLADEGRTVVAAVHDLGLAARYCDELVLLADGERVTGGTPGSVLTPETVERAFGVRAAVTTDPVTGTPVVTAVPETDGGDAGTVHVVGGGGAAAPHLRPLRSAGFDLSVGAVPAGGRDAAVAEAMGADVITVPPMQAPDDATERAVREAVRDADVTVVPDLDVHGGTRPNLTAAAAASALVVVESRPLAERNALGESGRECWSALREAGAVVGADEVTGAVARAVAGPTPDRNIPGD